MNSWVFPGEFHKSIIVFSPSNLRCGVTFSKGLPDFKKDKVLMNWVEIISLIISSE